MQSQIERLQRAADIAAALALADGVYAPIRDRMQDELMAAERASRAPRISSRRLNEGLGPHG
jgi:hypothetical protein